MNFSRASSINRQIERIQTTNEKKKKTQRRYPSHSGYINCSSTTRTSLRVSHSTRLSVHVVCGVCDFRGAKTLCPRMRNGVNEQIVTHSSHMWRARCLFKLFFSFFLFAWLCLTFDDHSQCRLNSRLIADRHSTAAILERQHSTNKCFHLFYSIFFFICRKLIVA